MSTSTSQATGPVTAAGKHRSSLNATTHGLFTQVKNLEAKERQAYQEFLDAYKADLRPQGALEFGLVRTLADTQWRLDRCRSIENQLMDDDSVSPHKLAASLNRFGLYAQRLARTLHTTLQQLRIQQAARLEREAAPTQAPAILPKPQPNKVFPNPPAPPTQPPFEFVFSTQETAAHAAATVPATPLHEHRNPRTEASAPRLLAAEAEMR